MAEDYNQKYKDLENALLTLILSQMRHNDIIDGLIANAKDPSLFQDWESIEKLQEEATDFIGQAIRYILPDIEEHLQDEGGKDNE